jgi:glucose/arabinose dehydrogenase
MDYGDFLTGTYEIASADGIARAPNLAYKAVALRLDPGPGGVAAGSTWIAFEHDTLRLAGAWTGQGFIDWRGINFDGRHNVHPTTVGTVFASTADAPGWADPSTGRFDDRRVTGLDGRRFGPLPQDWARYTGLERTDAGVSFSYRVGTTGVREHYALEPGPQVAVRRRFEIAAADGDLAVRVADAGIAVRLEAPQTLRISEEDGFVVVRIPASATPVSFDVVYKSALPAGPATAARIDEALPPSPAQTTDPVLESAIVRDPSDSPWSVDRFMLPARGSNPWRSWMRITGLEFLPNEAAAYLCTWEGEVWRVDGLEAEASTARWRRVATGLFQPLGIAFANGRLLVACRDQIVHLEDRDGDGVFDRYRTFNSDHQVTEHFHEFAMGLQVDGAGNLYYAKSARHAKTPLVPQHGTLLKVSADGARTEILARGFRAANGVCLNPDGSFFVTDQEGHWMPMNRVNRVLPGGFYGNMWGYGAPESTSDDAMAPPLVWVDKAMDRSPAELVRVEGGGWGALEGGLLSFSYGQGQVFLVTTQQVGDVWQGAYLPLPISSLPTGIMRGRFRREDGHLYVTGMSAWATNQVQEPGGFYRLRAQERPLRVVHAVNVHRAGVDLRLTEPLPDGLAPLPEQFVVSTWRLERSERYGSKRHDEASLAVAGVQLSADRRTVRLLLPSIAPVDQLEIVYRMGGDGEEGVSGRVLATVHALAETPALELP